MEQSIKTYVHDSDCKCGWRYREVLGGEIPTTRWYKFWVTKKTINQISEHYQNKAVDRSGMNMSCQCQGLDGQPRKPLGLTTWINIAIPLYKWQTMWGMSIFTQIPGTTLHQQLSSLGVFSICANGSSDQWPKIGYMAQKNSKLPQFGWHTISHQWYTWCSWPDVIFLFYTDFLIIFKGGIHMHTSGTGSQIRYIYNCNIKKYGRRVIIFLLHECTSHWCYLEPPMTND